MRIISGKYKGRKLKPPYLLPTRPTTDFAKEGLFNILANNWEFDELKMLDLFAGTGAHSFEFASRGCTDIMAIDNHGPAINFIQQTAEKLEAEGVHALKMDVFQFLKTANGKYDIIFADPPYDMERLNDLPDLVLEKELLEPEGWLIIEHGPDTHFEEHPRCFHQRKYGTTIFSIFRKE